MNKFIKAFHEEICKYIDVSNLYDREKFVAKQVLNGVELENIAISIGLKKERTKQIIGLAFRKLTKELINLTEQKKSNDRYFEVTRNRIKSFLQAALHQVEEL